MVTSVLPPDLAPGFQGISWDGCGQRKRPEPLLLLGVPAFLKRPWTLSWWRWRERYDDPAQPTEPEGFRPLVRCEKRYPKRDLRKTSILVLLPVPRSVHQRVNLS